MLNFRTIRRCISEGLVLDKSGQWQHIDEAIEEEKEYIIHLEKGEILENGVWIELKGIDEETLESVKEKQPVSTNPQDFQGEKKIPLQKEVPLAVQPTGMLNDEISPVAPDTDKKISPTEQDTLKTPEELLDTVEIDKKPPTVDQKIESLEAELIVVEPAKSDDSETRRYEVNTAEIIEATKTKLLNTETVAEATSQTISSEDELLNADEFETMISKMENVEETVSEAEVQKNIIPKTEKSDNQDAAVMARPSPISSPVKGVSSSGAHDAWDKARSNTTKVIIISGVVIGVIIILMLLGIFL